ncbi:MULTISPECIES: PIN domain-containing protein [unclassified Herbaspirillum]|uniref:PIN domain-containing protein n=1 Tax=unclassified Herbaspirillum TaxID=2624150 RepID=UPI001611737A|nr:MULTISPECIES: PIN domain-containing protein [unclassified Herbaspirillum]
MRGKAVVLDANILIRAVLGRRVRDIIMEYATTVQFFAPDVAYADAKKYLPGLLQKRDIDPSAAMAVLDRLASVVRCLDMELYGAMRQQALQRIAMRDVDDWPVLACAMTLECPIWTEDTDFFGTGVAIWTSDRIVLYLS